MTYHGLKGKYKQFLDNLSDLDLQNEGLEIVNLFYIASKDLFKSKRAPSFLKNYCFIKTVKNEISRLMEFATETNPNRHTRTHKLTMNLFKVLCDLFSDFCGTHERSLASKKI
jgi:hypothetical protein